MTRAKDLTGQRRYYHPIQKDYATFLKTSEETDGEYTLIEVEVAPGGGNDPHYHKTYNEHFEVLEGTLEVLVGEETLTLGPGQRAVGEGTPRNLYHLALLLEWSEVRLPGVFTITEPLFRLLAKRARRKGIDRKLEEAYVR